MTLRLSTGARNLLLQGMGFGAIFNRGSLRIFNGAQPASADAAETGTLLGIATANSGALTQETQASQTITLAAGAGGSVNTVPVGGMNIIPDGAVPFNTSLNQTASDLCDAINRNGIYTATVAGAIVTIKPRPGVGAAHNGYVVATTVTTLTATSGGNMAGGVSPVNGLIMASPSSGVIGKPLPAVQVWSFNGLAVNTAGWFRLIGSVADPATLVAGAPYYPRLDGTIAVSGGDMGLSNLAVTVGAPNTVDRFNMTQPQQ